MTNLKTKTFSIVMALLLAGVPTMQAQQPNNHIHGYLDQRGVFHADRPVASGEQDSALIGDATATTTSGVFNITLKITIDPKIPTSDTLSCEMNIEVVDETTGREYVEGVTAAATRSGSTATCTGIIEYQWPAISSSNSGLYVSGTVIAGPSTAARQTTWSFGTITLPASGATTSETYNIYI